MSKGALLIAHNNSKIDYIKQAVFAAKRIQEYMEIPVSIITDDTEYLLENYPSHPFDKIIEIGNAEFFTYRKYNDGLHTRNELPFKNTSRSAAYSLTPYNETLLLDTDFIVSSKILNSCFKQEHNLMMYKDAYDLTNWRDLSEFKFISNTGPSFYWATCIFFRKSETTECLFNLVNHIQCNWNHYRNVYQITSAVFRNDFAFSIAVHIMNGYTNGSLVKPMPGKKCFITDKDHVVSIKDDIFLFLVKNKNKEDYSYAKVSGTNVHIMNKFGLNRIIDESD